MNILIVTLLIVILLILSETLFALTVRTIVTVLAIPLFIAIVVGFARLASGV